jgi:CubicO group peptidase (beta-lactamase class C family)
MDNDDKKLDFKFEPGTRYAYSGEGIEILQLVVEERTGKPVADLLQTRVFDRFGMRSTSMTFRPDFEGRAATEYDADGLFYPAIEALFGRTCLPWFWMGYVPYTRLELLDAKARARPVPACRD